MKRADAFKNANNTVQRIARGKKYNDSNNTIDVGARKIREAGTFVRHMFTSWGNFLSVFEGVYDMIATSIVRKKLATIS